MIIKNPIPILEYDDKSLEVIAPNHTAPDLVLPKKCVFPFLAEKVDEFAASHNAKIITIFKTITMDFPVYSVNVNGEDICLARAPLGASAAGQFLDFLIGCGCKTIITTGSCGVLKDIRENAFLLPVKALRDEGTSYKYLPAERYVELNPVALDAIRTTFRELNLPLEDVTTWTTDGFFRETKDIVEYRKNEGCTVVDMECAALTAIAKKRGATFGQFLYTADSLANADNYAERDWGEGSMETALKLCFKVLKHLD